MKLACNIARVEVATDTGEVYGAERTLSANVFVDAIRTAHVTLSSDEGLEPIATGVTYRHDGRWGLAAARATDDDIEGVYYYLKNLVGMLDLFRGSLDQLIIRLHATTLGAPGGRKTPEVTMATYAAAQIVLMPSLLTRGLWLPAAPLVFTRVEHTAPPQQASARADSRNARASRLFDYSTGRAVEWPTIRCPADDTRRRRMPS